MRIGRREASPYLAALIRRRRHPRDVHTAADVDAARRAQNGGVRVRRWLDPVLVVALTAVAVWLTIGHADMFRAGDLQDRPAPPGVVRPMAPPEDGPTGWPELLRDLLLNVTITGALLTRRRWPLACLVTQFAALLVVDHEVNGATFVAILIGTYSLAMYGRSGPEAIGVLVAVSTVTAAAQTETWPRLPGWAGVFAILLPVGLFGVAIRAARSRAEAASQKADAMERGQQAATRLAVAGERARIARELHDVVSHHVSVMTIQAGAAGKVLDADPELARGALAAIESSGRETMTELRHLLGVLAPPADGDDLLHPQPGLDQLDTLVGNVRGAGQPVEVRREPVALPRGADLTAFRVVQEALTNALRHAPGARTEVNVSTVDDAVLVEIANDAPPGAVPASVDGSGTGLLGLAERLRLYGGTLETGARVGGGFRVCARIPFDAEAA